MNNIFLRFIASVASFALSAAVQAQGYDYTSVDYPGAFSTNLFGVNQSGKAVGNGSVGEDGMPFVFNTRKGTITNIAPLTDYDRTAVIGITDNGTIVGDAVTQEPFRESGVAFDRNGAVTIFDHPDAASVTQPRAVNNRGQVTGFRNTSDPFQGVAGFIYDLKSGTFTDIVPSLSTIAQGINDRGDVVGSAVFLPDDDPCDTGAPFLPRLGWLRTADGEVTYFIVNGQRTSARAISESGTVGGFVEDPSTGETKGFVTELDGTQCQEVSIAEEDLLQFPGAVSTFVQGITNSGTVIGTYADESFIGGGFVATPN